MILTLKNSDIKIKVILIIIIIKIIIIIITIVIIIINIIINTIINIIIILLIIIIILIIIILFSLRDFTVFVDRTQNAEIHLPTTSIRIHFSSLLACRL